MVFRNVTDMMMKSRPCSIPSARGRRVAFSGTWNPGIYAWVSYELGLMGGQWQALCVYCKGTYTGNLEENWQSSGTYRIPEDFSVLWRGGVGVNPERPSETALVGKSACCWAQWAEFGLRIHMLGRENWLLQFVLSLLHKLQQCSHIHTNMHTYIHVTYLFKNVKGQQ